MTLRFPIPAPRSDEGTVLPAILLAALAVMAALQLLLAGARGEEAVATMAGRPGHYVAPRIDPVPTPTAILEQPIFSPGRTLGKESTPGGQGLDGAQVAGALSIGHRTRLLLRQSNGLMITLHPGETYGGWQFLATTAEGARFGRSGETMLIPFGASAPLAATPSEDQSEQEEEQQ